MEAIYSLRQLIKKYQAKRKNMHRVFNKVLKDLIWWGFNKRNVPRGYVEIIKDMYE